MPEALHLDRAARRVYSQTEQTLLDQMRTDLRALGWQELSQGIWLSPAGARFYGPQRAWQLAAHAQAA